MHGVAREVATEMTQTGGRHDRLRRSGWLLAAGAALIAAWTVVDWGLEPGVRVRGRVAIGGQPLADGLISFHAAREDAAGKPVAGAAIRDGRYEVAGRGLPWGKYVVRIRSPRVPRDGTRAAVAPPAEDLVPAEFNDESTLVIEVSRFGRNRFDFEIP